MSRLIHPHPDPSFLMTLCFLMTLLRQSPFDFMMSGTVGAENEEPIGLRLIPNYHLEVLRIEILGF